MKKEKPQLDDLLTVPEAAAALKVGRGTLDNWRVLGAGPRYVKFGRHVRYSKNDLAAWVAAKTRQSTSQPVD
jgi:excisionase family DNA binding protein